MAVAEKVRTNVYLNRRAKEKAQEVLKKYGLNLSDAINIFLAIIAETRSLPFEFRIPNRGTRRAIQDVLKGKNLEEIKLSEFLNEVKEAQGLHKGSEESPDN